MNLIRPGMGTENASLLLATFVRMLRPNVVLEIGAGDSTIALANALQAATSDWENDRAALLDEQWSERVALLDPSRIPDRYSPKLITVDNFSGEGSSAEAAWAQLEAAGVDDGVVHFIQDDFFNIPDASFERWGELDLVWIDAGTPADDVRFVADLWHRVKPGGFLVLHEPTMLSPVRKNSETRLEVVRNPLWEELSAAVNDGFELITFPEPHKYRQSGVGVIRKRRVNERVVRLESLQEELLNIDEPPIRNDFIPTDFQRNHMNDGERVLEILQDSDTRLVHAAITLGNTSLASIVNESGLELHAVKQSIKRLLLGGLVSSHGGELQAEENVWEGLQTNNLRSSKNLSDSQLESIEVLDKIAALFDMEKEYSEDQVSSMCSMFTTDFARLRRKLVDEAYLTRIDGFYRRS